MVNRRLYLILWEACVLIFAIPKFVLPAPSAIIESLVKWAPVIAIHAWQTLFTTLIGFVLAVLGGLGIGIAVGWSTLLYRALYPLLIAFNSVPKVAIVPILVIWFGIGTPPAIITAFMLAFFPIVVNVAAGLATVEPELEDVLRLRRIKKDILLKVGLPACTLFLCGIESCNYTRTCRFGYRGTIAANKGIGYLMLNASSRFDVPLVFAGLIVVATGYRDL